MKIAERISGLNKKIGLRLLLDLLKECELPFLQEEIVNNIRKLTGKNFGFDPVNIKEKTKRP